MESIKKETSFLDEFDPTVSDRGYRRIYDCGHLVFKYTQI